MVSIPKYNVAGSTSHKLVQVFYNEFLSIDEIAIALIRVRKNLICSELVLVEYHGERTEQEVIESFQEDTAGLQKTVEAMAKGAAISAKGFVGDWTYDSFAPETKYDLIMNIAEKWEGDTKIIAIAYFNDTKRSILDMLGSAAEWKEVEATMNKIRSRFQESQKDGGATEVKKADPATQVMDSRIEGDEYVEVINTHEPIALYYEIKG